MKKLMAFVFAFAVASFSQDTYAPEATSVSQQDDISAYTSGAPAPETPLVNINETKVDEPMFFVSFHPLSLLIFSIFDITSFYVTLEGNIGSNFGLVVRPLYFDIALNDDDEDLEIAEYGVALGLRYYFNPLHRGVYLEPRIEYARVEAEYEEDYHEDDASVKGNSFGLGALCGYKITSGHFSMFLDVGYEYVIVSLTGRSKDDAEDAFGVGGGYDFNMGIGFAF